MTPLSKSDVTRMMDRAKTDRDALLIETLYVVGATSREAAQLRGTDIGVRSVALWGSRPRVVRVPAPFFRRLVQFQSAGFARIFGVGDRQVRRIVKEAAIAAGLGDRVAPATLRRAHAAHAIDRGCPLVVVQRTLGLRPTLVTPHLHGRPGDSSALYVPG